MASSSPHKNIFVCWNTGDAAKWFPTGHLASENPTIDHRPSTIDHRPSTIDHRPSTSDQRPAAIGERRATSGDQVGDLVTVRRS
jgi:hypothetical protein